MVVCECLCADDIVEIGAHQGSHQVNVGEVGHGCRGRKDVQQTDYLFDRGREGENGAFLSQNWLLQFQRIYINSLKSLLLSTYYGHEFD